MTPLPEHWQYAALGALSMTPILGVFWSVARGWRLKVAPLKVENERLHSDKAQAAQNGKTLADQVIVLTCRLADERALVRDHCDRLNRIIARGKTKSPNSTVKAMVRIAEGA